MHDPDNSPINPLPPVVIALSVVIIGVEALFSLASRGILGGAQGIGWRNNAIQGYGFNDGVFDQMLELGVFPPEHLLRFISYPFIHGNFTHAVFAVVFLLALGKMVAEIFRVWAVLVIFFGSAIFGALAWALLQSTQLWLIGAFPAVYGLIGAYTFLLWVNYGATGENQYRAFLMISLLMGIQLLWSLVFGAGNDWIADLAGFTAGFCLSFIVSPGGWGRVMERIRRR